jgi:hypothetical protein
VITLVTTEIESLVFPSLCTPENTDQKSILLTIQKKEIDLGLAFLPAANGGAGRRCAQQGAPVCRWRPPYEPYLAATEVLAQGRGERGAGVRERPTQEKGVGARVRERERRAYAKGERLVGDHRLTVAKKIVE